MTQQLEKELQEEFSQALKLESMSLEERAATVGKFAELALEAALGRLLLTLDETEQIKLELYVDTHPNDQHTIEYLLKTYPLFTDFLEEEMQALQREAIAILG